MGICSDVCASATLLLLFKTGIHGSYTYVGVHGGQIDIGAHGRHGYAQCIDIMINIGRYAVYDLS